MTFDARQIIAVVFYRDGATYDVYLEVSTLYDVVFMYSTLVFKNQRLKKKQYNAFINLVRISMTS